MVVTCPFCEKMYEVRLLYRPSELAGLLRVSPRTIHLWIRKGIIRARVWVRGSRKLRYVIDYKAVEDFLDSHFPNVKDLSPTSKSDMARTAYKIRFWNQVAANEARAKRWKQQIDP